MNHGVLRETRTIINQSIVANPITGGSGHAHIYQLANRLFSASTLETGLVSCAQFEAPVFNQKGGSCEAHRASQGLWSACAAAGSPLPWIPSPDALYKAARILARLGSPTTPLTDSGVTTSTLLQALSTIGIKAIATTAVPGPSFTDVVLDAINNNPLITDLATEGLTITAGEYAQDIADTSAAIIVGQQSIAANIPVWVDAWVDTAFMNWSGGAPLDTVDLNDPNGGWHALLWNELSVSSALNALLSLLNSWGPGYGVSALDTNCPNKGGHVQVTANWFAKAVDGMTIGKVTR